MPGSNSNPLSPHTWMETSYVVPHRRVRTDRAMREQSLQASKIRFRPREPAMEGACHPHDTITIAVKTSAVNMSARLESRAASATIPKIFSLCKKLTQQSHSRKCLICACDGPADHRTVEASPRNVIRGNNKRARAPSNRATAMQERASRSSRAPPEGQQVRGRIHTRPRPPLILHNTRALARPPGCSATHLPVRRGMRTASPAALRAAPILADQSRKPQKSATLRLIHQACGLFDGTSTFII